jgi:hypothetical protein
MNKIKLSNQTIIIIFFIIIVIIIILYNITKKYNLESFINSESEMEENNVIINPSFDNDFNPPTNISSVFGMNFQIGKSGISSTGTIYFKTPFSRPPMILTQMIGDTSTINNIYSIQVFGITNTSFNYSKNKLYNYQVSDENLQNATLMSLEPSTAESFMWIAFG